MAKKTLKLNDKTITVWERKGFFGIPKVSIDKVRFDTSCKTLLEIFAKLAKKNKLPTNTQEVMAAIAQSYKHTEASFKKRNPKAIVLDVDGIINQLI